jgi:hypothetical protein
MRFNDIAAQDGSQRAGDGRDNSPGAGQRSENGLVLPQKIALDLPNSSHCHLPQMRHNDDL